MRTISTLCASGAAVSASTIGLAFARADQHEVAHLHDHPGRSSSPMTELAQRQHANRLPHASPYSLLAYSTPEQGRFADDHGEYGRTFHSASAKVGSKRSLQLTPRASFSAGKERSRRRVDGEAEAQQPGSVSGGVPQTWFRRLSSNMSGSRDSSRAPSRPSTAAVSHSNGSFTLSQTGSTVPMVPSQTPQPLPPNKLVKRAPSDRAASGSPLSGSKLPLPVLRRPATSHQRSSMLRDSIPSYVSSTQFSFDADSQDTRDSRWHHYFTPRIASEFRSIPIRPRTSSGIPNPVKRIYPDRRYTPVLVSASDLSRPASVMIDHGSSVDESEDEIATKPALASAPASPLLRENPFAERETTPRRSFSIGDLLSSGPQPLWRRPTSSRSRTAFSRRGRSRGLSMPSTLMGVGEATDNTDNDLQRPAKRRELESARVSSQSRRSSVSSYKPITAQTHDESDVPHTADVHLLSSPTPMPPPLADNAVEPLSRDSNSFNSATVRPARLSAAASEPASTVGSESEIRSLGDTSTDYQSDHIFDSIPTRTTRSSSGRRGPHIETIFDDSSPSFSSGRSNKLRDFLSDGQTPTTERNQRYRHSTIEEEGSVFSTPVRSLHNRSVNNTPSARHGESNIFSSSPPTMNLIPDADDSDWDIGDDDDDAVPHKKLSFATSNTSTPVNKSLPFHFGPALRFSNSNSANSTPQRNGITDKANLFDWAEPQPSPGQATNSPPRPKTVHGKKEPDTRGSRSAGRRAPSGMHARSHSVPVVPDTDGKRTNMSTNKFGTWGVGSKAVTEDWDEDFDFTGPGSGADPQDDAEPNGKRIDSGRDFDVPSRVKASQENVVANIGLLREWLMLIEELKELRIRAVALDIMHGQYEQSWQEVDAMIELADQESEEKTLEPRRSPPSSPGFDFDAFEDAVGRSPRASFTLPEPVAPTPETPQSSTKVLSRHNTPTSRTRKNSELVAQSVIAALQNKRNANDSSLHATSRTKKVPFDTATLRHIVPYVNTLKRKVKDALRETEGLYTSPRRRSSVDRRSSIDDEPSFRSIFNDSHDDGTTRRQTGRDRGSPGRDRSGSLSDDPTNDLAARFHAANLLA